MEKLDVQSKILLATQTINWMANALYPTSQQIKLIPDPDGIHQPSIIAMDNVLADSLAKMVQICEDMGNVMNAFDCISEIDVRVTDPAMKILISGQDEVGNMYDETKNSIQHKFVDPLPEEFNGPIFYIPVEDLIERTPHLTEEEKGFLRQMADSETGLIAHREQFEPRITMEQALNFKPTDQ